MQPCASIVPTLNKPVMHEASQIGNLFLSKLIFLLSQGIPRIIGNNHVQQASIWSCACHHCCMEDLLSIESNLLKFFTEVCSSVGWFCSNATCHSTRGNFFIFFHGHFNFIIILLDFIALQNGSGQVVFHADSSKPVVRPESPNGGFSFWYIHDMS